MTEDAQEAAARITELEIELSLWREEAAAATRQIATLKAENAQLRAAIQASHIDPVGEM